MSSQSKVGKIEWLSKWAEVIWWDASIADHFVHERIWLTSFATGVQPDTCVCGVTVVQFCLSSKQYHFWNMLMLQIANSIFSAFLEVYASSSSLGWESITAPNHWLGLAAEQSSARSTWAAESDSNQSWNTWSSAGHKLCFWVNSDAVPVGYVGSHRGLDCTHRKPKNACASQKQQWWKCDEGHASGLV